jgi:hypothetical protein
MKPITYSMQFRGVVTELAAGVLSARTSAPGCTLTTVVDDDGVHGRFTWAPGEEAELRCEVVFEDDEGFEQRGVIHFGAGNSLRFRTLARGVLGPSRDPHLRHGTAMWGIDGGEGRFRGAEGRITSNFFLSDTGEVTDNQLGVIFVQDAPAGAPHP